MSLESRYDSLLKDMITLLQEALCRFFTDKEVDVSKFKQYFCQFYKGLTNLQDGFHEKTTKFSKGLTKLSDLFEKSSSTKFSLQPTPLKTIEPSETLSKPKVSSQAPLNIIGEQQQFYESEKKRRSGTAEGRRRPENFIIDFSQGKYRPKTGVSRQSKRYKNSVNVPPTSQTISHETDSKFMRTFHSRELDQNEGFQKRQRKSFYDDLEREHTKAEIIYENMIKIPKKKSISSHRWSFKINKLF